MMHDHFAVGEAIRVTLNSVPPQAKSEAANFVDKWGPTLVPLIVSLVALAGVIAANWNAARIARASELERTKNAVILQVLEVRRPVIVRVFGTLVKVRREALAFNASMYGNSGEGEDDNRSAASIVTFLDAVKELRNFFQESSFELLALGSDELSQILDAIGERIEHYTFRELDPSSGIFRASVAVQFEEDLEQMIQQFRNVARRDLGAALVDNFTERAHV